VHRLEEAPTAAGDRYDAGPVTSLASLTEELRRRADSLSPAEARLAAHLVEHPEQWGFSPTTELATLLGVHRSTVVRFAQRLGFPGYPELQEVVRTAYLHSVASPSDLTITTPGAEHDGLVHTVYEREVRNLRQTYAKLDGAALEATATSLAGARHVVVFGRRFSYAIAVHLNMALRTMRPGVRLAPEVGGSSVDALFDLGPEDAALVVSLRRHSPEVRTTLRFLTERRVPTTLLTDASPVSGLQAEVRLLQAHIGSPSMLDSFTALISLSHTLLSLTSARIPDAQQRLERVERAWTGLSDS
jgi:DNA-binding MurR/RpiR family transcriptional regulator